MLCSNLTAHRGLLVSLVQVFETAVWATCLDPWVPLLATCWAERTWGEENKHGPAAVFQAFVYCRPSPRSWKRREKEMKTTDYTLAGKKMHEACENKKTNTK